MKMSKVRSTQIAEIIKNENFNLGDFEFNPHGSSYFNLIYKKVKYYKYFTDDKGDIEYWPALNGEIHFENKNKNNNNNNYYYNS